MVNKPENGKQLLSIKKFAKYSGLSEATIGRYIRDGSLPHFRIGKRGAIRIDPDSLQEFYTPAKYDLDQPTPKYQHNPLKNPKL